MATITSSIIHSIVRKKENTNKTKKSAACGQQQQYNNTSVRVKFYDRIERKTVSHESRIFASSTPTTAAEGLSTTLLTKNNTNPITNKHALGPAVRHNSRHPADRLRQSRSVVVEGGHTLVRDPDLYIHCSPGE